MSNKNKSTPIHIQSLGLNGRTSENPKITTLTLLYKKKECIQ